MESSYPQPMSFPAKSRQFKADNYKELWFSFWFVGFLSSLTHTLPEGDPEAQWQQMNSTLILMGAF